MTRGRGSRVLHYLTPFWETDRSLTLLLGLLLLVIFVIVPLAGLGRPGALLYHSVFVLLLLSGIAAVARTRAWFRVLTVVVVLAIGARAVALVLPQQEALVARAAVSMIFCALLTFVIGERVLRRGPINHYRIQGAVAVYLLIGVLFAHAYDLVYQLSPGAFAFETAPGNDDELVARLVYFSFATLTTVGYGDITALHPSARSLAMLEALLGQLFPAVLIARLVGLSIRG